MQLKRLYLKNFLCIGEDPVEINFSTSGGITVIRGINHDVATGKSSNGSGKSTFIEGILFAIYGETLRPLTLPNIPNSKTKGDCIVEFEYDDVKIVRELIRKKKKVEHRIAFTVNGELQGTNASVLEIQKSILQKIGVNSGTMCNILIFGQHNMVSFLDASEAEKRDIVESLMNLEEYNAFEQKARDSVREMKTEIKVLSETHLLHMNHLGEQVALRLKQEKALEEYRQNLRKEIDEINERIITAPNLEFVKKEWERFNADTAQKQLLEKDVSDLQTQRAVLSEDLATIQAARQKEEAARQPDLLNRHNELKGKIQLLDQRKAEVIKEQTDWIVEKIEDLSGKIKKLSLQETKDLQEVLPSQNWNAILSTCAKQVKDAEHRLKSLDDVDLTHEETCPTCFGKVDPANIDNVRKVREQELADEVKKLNDSIAAKLQDEEAVAAKKKKIATEYDLKNKECINERTSLYEQQAAILKEIGDQARETRDKIEAQFKKVTAEIAAFAKEMDDKYSPLVNEKTLAQKSVIDAIGAKQRELYLVNNAKRPAVSLEDLATIAAQLDADKKLHAEKVRASKDNPYANIISSLEENIREADKKAKEAESNLKAKEKLLPYYEWWVTHFGKQGIKSYVIDQIIPTLNEQIEYWMQMIYQGTISVEFDKFLNVTMINNASKNEMVFGQGSGGERRRVDLAIMLAFRQVMQLSTGRSPSVLFFDEVAENLDEDGVYRLFDAINDISKTSMVYVITHNPVLLGLLQNAHSITLEKRKGITTLVK